MILHTKLIYPNKKPQDFGNEIIVIIMTVYFGECESNSYSEVLPEKKKHKKTVFFLVL